MVSEEQRLQKELREARQALEYQNNKRHHQNEFFELETEIQLEENDWLLYMDVDELEERVERLERDLRDLQRGEFQYD
jgi:uncharacterized membrane protein YcgQ (UPF0703/DUF1980 family)